MRHLKRVQFNRLFLAFPGSSSLALKCGNSGGTSRYFVGPGVKRALRCMPSGRKKATGGVRASIYIPVSPTLSEGR
jgi:hypothetical protein